MSSQHPSPFSSGRNGGFELTMVDTGTQPVVAAELERRVEIIEREELDDASRQPFSAPEIAVYVGVSVLAVVTGIMMVIL